MARAQAMKGGRTGRKRWSGNCITRLVNIWPTGIRFMNGRKQPGKHARRRSKSASVPIMPTKSRRTSSSCQLIIFARSISLVTVNILSDDIYTRGDNVALDVFRVSDLRGRAVTNEREMAFVESTLRKALEGEAFDLSVLLEQARKKGRRHAVAELEF